MLSANLKITDKSVHSSFCASINIHTKETLSFLQIATMSVCILPTESRKRLACDVIHPSLAAYYGRVTVHDVTARDYWAQIGSICSHQDFY